jgi:solute carrier family 25 carnitine/acylcarnitine transporter 20/29
MKGISVPLFSITLVRTTSFSIYETSKRFYGNWLHHPLYSPPIRRRNRTGPVTTPPYQGFFALNAWSAFLAGFTSGAFITILACPFEFTKLATQIELLMRRTQIVSSPDPTNPTDAKGPLQMAREIYSTRGFRGLYSGFTYHFGMAAGDANLARDAVGTGIYFSAYESTKYLLSGTAIPGPLTYAISGGCCGVVAWCLVFPIDTAKVIPA